MLRSSVLLLVLLLAAAGCATHPVAVHTEAGPEPEPVVAVAPAGPQWPDPTSTTVTVPPTTTTVAPPPPEPSTTTTMPPSTSAPAVHKVHGAGQVNGYPCGGELPPCWVLRRESGGDPTAVNPDGCGGASCGGLWQFDPRTWAGYGGFTYAQDAPASVQNQRAAQLWAGGAGCAHWAAC